MDGTKEKEPKKKVLTTLPDSPIHKDSKTPQPRATRLKETKIWGYLPPAVNTRLRHQIPRQ